MTTANYAIVGKSVTRKGLLEKLTGEARYTSDMKLEGMLHGRIVRSPHPHAEVLSVDTSAAVALAGVRAVVTPFDAPQGHIAADLPTLDRRVRFVGDEVAAVAADDADTAAAALDLIRVEYRILPHVVDAEEALQPDAPQLYADGNLATGKPLVLERGDVEQGFAEADLVVEDVFRTPGHSPSPIGAAGGAGCLGRRSAYGVEMHAGGASGPGCVGIGVGNRPGEHTGNRAALGGGLRGQGRDALGGVGSGAGATGGQAGAH